MNVPLKTNANDETVFAICRMGLCVWMASQKQPVSKQVAGFQLSQALDGNSINATTVNTEMKTAAEMGNA